MKQRIFLFGTLIISWTVGMTQAPQLVKVTPPSPNASAFQKYGDIPVSPYTGIPDISIPVYTVQFRDIDIPITLSYHASGIKVNDESSQVGLGWTVNTGGCISRNIIGTDDFLNWSYFNNYANNLPDLTYNHGPTNFMATGCLLPRFNRNIPQNPTLDTLNLTTYLDGTYDFQPDQYFYNFLGHSGKFLLRRNRTAAIQKAEKVEIICLDTLGNAFRIRDLNGFIYDFAQYETNYENPGNIAHHSAWYLTKITSPTGNSVTYKYSVISNRIYTLGSYSITRDDYQTPLAGPFLYYSGGAFPTQEGTAPPRNYSHVQLDTIEFTTGIVKFFYSDRADVEGDKMLDSVSVFTRDAQGALGATPLKTISLTHTYFDYGANDNDWGSTTYASKRLKLTQVTEKGYYGGAAVQGNPYKFTYYEGGSLSLPSKNSFARDHWNYYNGMTNNTSLLPTVIPVNSPDQITYMLGGQGPQRDPSASFMDAFSLASIQYPTGGSTELQYESNDFDEVASQVNDASYYGKIYNIVQQQQTINYDNIAKHFTSTDTADLRNEYQFTNNAGQTASYNIHMLARFRFSSPTTDCSRTFAPNDITFDIYDSSGTSILIHKDMTNFSLCSGTTTNNCMFCQAGVFSYNADIILQPGKYVVRFNASSAYNTALQDVAWTFTYYTQQSTPPGYSNYATTYTIGGGLRIKRIIDHDSLNAANDQVKRYVYHYSEDKNGDGSMEEYSYGKRMSKPNYSYFQMTSEHIQNDCQPICIHMYGWSSHLMRSSDSNTPLNGSAGGAIVGYDRVTVLEGENGENGKTVYQYTNVPDIINPYNDQNGLPMRPPFSSTIPEQLNGSLIKQTIYTASGKKVKEITNTYTSIMDNENTIYGMEPRPFQKYVTTLSGGGGASRSQDNVAPCDLLLISYWHQKSVWNYQSSTSEKTYAQADTTKFEETATNFYYDDTSHLLPTRLVTVNSKGDTIKTINTYPLSYTSLTSSDPITQGVLNLRNRHIINASVEKYVQRVGSGGSNARVTSGVVTSYGASSPLPTIAYTTNAASPITNFAALIITSGGATLDTRYRPLIYFDQYDNYGNITQQHKANDILNSYIWDYNASSPIAECENAAANEIAYTSFEWDGSGNWTITSASRSTADAVTGKRSYVLSNGNITKSISNTTKSYVISFWTKSGSATVNSTSAATSLTRNGWTYNEAVIAAGTSSITISGAATIDELRLYPSDAQMTTYTYEPLVGLTSQTDINNRVNYYEYDGLGRLMLIRDMFGNIVKTIKYHYKNN
jgi:hypothetical protein